MSVEFPEDPIDVVGTVSLALRDTLVRYLPRDLGVEEDDIQFRSPGDKGDDRQTRILIYLYRFGRYTAMRNAEAPLPAAALDGTGLPVAARIERPPLACESNYLVVPYARDPVRELQLIGAIRRLWYALGILTPEMLDPRLARQLEDTGNTALRLVSLDPGIDEISKIWGFFTSDHTYKLGLYYLIEPIWLPVNIARPVPRVTTILADSSGQSR